MFIANFLFELRSTLRRPTIYVATALLFTYWSIFSSRLNMDPNFWGPNGGVHANAPVVLYFTLATQAFVTFLFVPLIMGSGPLRERGAKLTEAWLAIPMRPVTALWGRFCAAFILLSTGTLVASSGILVSPYLRMALGKMPGLTLGPTPWAHLIHAWSIILLPTLFFASALVFWLVVLVRRPSAAIAATIVLVLGAVISHYFGKTMHFETLQIIDPTAFHAVHRSVSYWTIEQRNHAFLSLSTPFLANRLIWLAVGISFSFLGSLTFKRSRFLFGTKGRRSRLALRHPQDQRPQSDIKQALETIAQTRRTVLATQFFARLRQELNRIGREPLFNAVLVTFFLWLMAQNLGALELEFIKAPAHAELLVTARRGLWMLVFYFVPYVTASTIFFERNLLGGEYLDALPIPNWMQWIPKISALAIYCATFPFLVLLASLTTQLLYGEFTIEASTYAQILMTSYYPYLLQFVLISFSISLLCPSRPVAYAVTMLTLYASIFGYETSNLDSELGLQMYETVFLWSPFDGLGPYAAKVQSKSLFWLCVALICVTLSSAFWKRGARSRRPETNTPARAMLLLAFAALGLGLARFVHHETVAWDQTRLKPQSDELRVQYEQALSKYRHLRSPLVDKVDLELDLFPHQSSYTYAWRALVQMQDLEQSPQLFVQTPLHDNIELQLDGAPLPSVAHFEDLGVQIFEVEDHRPDAGLRLLSVRSEHHFAGQPRKRERPLGVTENGSYLSQDALPGFKYRPQIELDTTLRRSLHQLGPNVAPTPPSKPGKRDCPWSGKQREWTIELSTRDNQYAVAPGALQKTWSSDGRRHFRYASLRPDCSAFAFASARYEVHSTQWTLEKKQSVSGRVLFLPGYESQAEQMEQATGRALNWLSSILGPYPYDSLQIVQVRDDANLGVSPANTLFLRESEAWALRVETPKDEHQRLYYIVLRLAQHWLHNQLAPADAPGKELFSEGIPAYLAHLWLSENFGEAWVQKKYLHRAMRRYFWYHGAHTSTEAPVIASPVIEHIHNYKAALALRVYAKSMGSSRMHALLRSLLSERTAQPLTATRFVEALDNNLPKTEEHRLGSEMLRNIIHYDNRIESAHAEQIENGRIRLTLTLKANRWQSSTNASKPSAIPWTRPLPVLIRFSSDQTKHPDQTEQFVVQNGHNHIEIELDALPTKVIIDPEMTLLDISRKDQAIAVHH